MRGGRTCCSLGASVLVSHSNTLNFKNRKPLPRAAADQRRFSNNIVPLFYRILAHILVFATTKTRPLCLKCFSWPSSCPNGNTHILPLGSLLTHHADQLCFRTARKTNSPIFQYHINSCIPPLIPQLCLHRTGFLYLRLTNGIQIKWWVASAWPL